MKPPLKIAVLEWVTGGGMWTTAAAEIPASLRSEGWQMLSSLVSGLLAAGCQVHVPFDPRLVSQRQRQNLQFNWSACASEGSTLLAASATAQLHWYEVTSNRLLEQWLTAIGDCSLAWLIAPEIDHTLPQLVEDLTVAGVTLLNCRGTFLRNACDKLATSQKLKQAGISHPETCPLEDVDQIWLDSTAPHSALNPQPARWVVKPVDGAGCERIKVVDRTTILRLQQDQLHMQQQPKNSPEPTQATTMLVQPWLEGLPASCSAIVDSIGCCHWLPLVSQDFAGHGMANSDNNQPVEHLQAFGEASPPLRYLGCTLPPRGLPAAVPEELLQSVITALGPGAAGWIGIDLLYHPSEHTWTVIEVNSRCTSSLIGLSQAYTGNLVFDVWCLHAGVISELTGEFQPIQYRIETS